jgi:hypothetical protein
VKLDRREVLKLAAGAALARPFTFASEAAAAALPPGRFFTGPELALLNAVSEIILPADDHSPGAQAAGVAAFVDGELAEKDPKIPEWAEERGQAREHLQALQGLSMEMHGKAFLDSSPEERIAVITRAAAGEASPKTAAEKAFKWAKDRTAHAYYTSKIGLQQEIRYKGNSLQVEYAGEEPK